MARIRSRGRWARADPEVLFTGIQAAASNLCWVSGARTPRPPLDQPAESAQSAAWFGGGAGTIDGGDAPHVPPVRGDPGGRGQWMCPPLDDASARHRPPVPWAAGTGDSLPLFPVSHILRDGTYWLSLPGVARDPRKA